MLIEQVNLWEPARFSPRGRIYLTPAMWFCFRFLRSRPPRPPAQSLISHMDILPIELHQEVFLHAVGRRPSDYRVLYAIAGTCRYWRDTCLQTPDLWAHLELSDPIVAHDIDRAKLYLSRSAQVPLDITIRSAEVYFTDDGEPFHQALSLIAAQAHRWRNCHFYLPISYVAHLWDTLGSQRTPLLEELIMEPVSYRYADLVNQGYETMGDELATFLPHAPRLLRLESHAAPMIPAQSWSSLRYLNYSLRNIVDDPLWVTLPNTPGLVELNIYFPGRSWYRAPSVPLTADIPLLSLKRLGVFGFWGNPAWTQRLKMPNVEKLTVSVESCNLLHPLFAVLKGKIRHLVLGTVQRPVTGYLGRVDAVAADALESGIETIEIWNLTKTMIRVGYHGLFEYLMEREPASPLAQCRRLILRDCVIQLGSVKTLLDFIKLRSAEMKTEARESSFKFEVVNTSLINRATKKHPAWFQESAELFAGVNFIHNADEE